MDSRKTILWIEDFANEPVLMPDDFDPSSEFIPDRIEQIRDIFPDYLVDDVQVIEDPTKLSSHMSKYGSNYEFVLLDVNFEVGISQDPDERDTFLRELKSANINITDLSDDTVKKLGYKLYYYLLAKWGIQHDNIAFLSAYCNEDEATGLIDRTFGPILPIRFDKRDQGRLKEFLDRRFSPDTISDSTAIIKAKDLFYFWSEQGIPNDSILFTASNSPKTEQRAATYKADITTRIANKLQETDSSQGQAAFDGILREIAFPFEATVNSTAPYWPKSVFEVLKLLRNPYSHRPNPNHQLSAIEFLMLASIGLRAIFESLSKPVPLLEGEQWLINGLQDITSQAGIAGKLDHEQQNIRVEEKVMQWFMSIASRAKFIGEGYNMLCNKKTKTDYLPEDVIHLFCIKAKYSSLVIYPNIMSSHSFSSEGGPETRISPKITCRFQSGCNPDHIRREGNCESRAQRSVPPVMRQLAQAYILSQIEWETECPKKFFINL